MSDKPRVTIVISPRERFSLSERTLSSVFEHTKPPFRLIYAAGGTPERLKERLAHESMVRGFELLLKSEYISPNQARNLAIPEVDTEFVVFLDSDALVAPQWLDHLLQCADETGAWVVGPLYLIHEFEHATIHMAGGWLRSEERDGKRYLIDEQHLYDTPLAKVKTRLNRRQCDYVEFHCMLVRNEVFDRIGLLDEELLNLHEERDFCMSVTRAGGDVYLEPRAVVSYVPPPPCEWSDLPYFMLRWSEDWSLSSVRAFNRKWSIGGVRHVSDQSEAYEEGTVIGFASAWRSRVAGTRFSNTVGEPINPLNQSLLMVALLASVGRQTFSLTVRDRYHTLVKQMIDTPVSDVLQAIAALPDPDYGYHLDLMSEPTGVKVPLLLRLCQLNKVQAEKLRPQALLVLEASAAEYECWFAAGDDSLRRALGQLDMAEQVLNDTIWVKSVTLAGGLLGEVNPENANSPRTRLALIHGQMGRLLSEYELMEMNLVDLVAHSKPYLQLEQN